MNLTRRCHYCNQPADTRDHIFPKSKGGVNNSWNIVPACFSCNQAKGNDLPTCRCPRCASAYSRMIQLLQTRPLIKEEDSEQTTDVVRPIVYKGGASKAAFDKWYATFKPRGARKR